MFFFFFVFSLCLVFSYQPPFSVFLSQEKHKNKLSFNPGDAVSLCLVFSYQFFFSVLVSHEKSTKTSCFNLGDVVLKFQFRS